MTIATSPVGASFRAIGTVHHVVATDPATLGPAIDLAVDYLAALDRAASRFRADSEVSRLARTAGGRIVTTMVSPMLTEHLRAALHVARLTGGLVDPTVGRAVVAQGYDDDLAVVRARATYVVPTPAAVPGWRSVVLDGSLLTLPGGTLLDLGACAKAHAVDVLARRMTTELGGGFLVNLGGDIAVAGSLPAGGWQIGIDSDGPRRAPGVTSNGQAIATSSVVRRSWTTDEGRRHHLVDPRTGRSEATPWAQVSCAGTSALEANAASSAAVLLGEEAVGWLESRRIPGRLERPDGTVTLTGGWPDGGEPASPQGAAA